MNNFEWQQEDGDWDEPQNEPVPESSNSKRTLVVGIILVLAIAIAGVIVYWQVNEQVQRAETAVQTNILASHNLVQTAAATEDSELLLSVLSGKLPSWTDAQQETLSANVMYDRAPWGLALAEEKPDVLDVTELEGMASLVMSPDLLEAELQFPLDYQFMTSAGVTKTVTLSQTAVYRQGIRNWLLSPPDSEFWGDWQTNEGQRLTLIYPKRDSELASQLAADLEQILKEICAHPDLPPCAEDAAYTIRLDSHPESLLDAADIRNFLDEEPYLNMPTPTLFGIPGDELAYEALLQAYAVPLGTAVFADLFEWECCRQATLFQMLVEYQLADMGMTSWPITTEDHIRALKEGRTFLNVSDFWRYQPDDFSEPVWFLYTAFDFIFRQYPNLTPVALLSSFENWGDIGYWLDNNLTQSGYQLGSVRNLWPTLQNEWWYYAYTQTLLAQEKETPPIPLPDQDIVLVCSSDPQFDLDTTMSLRRFNQAEDTWQEMLAYNDFVSFTPFLNDEGLMIQTLDLDETNQWQTELWNFNGIHTQFENEGQMFLSLGQYDPSGQYAVAYYIEDEAAIPQLLLINLQSCDEKTCEMSKLSGTPIWSPNGERTLVSSDNVFESGSVAFQQNGRMILFDTTLPPATFDFWLGDKLGDLPAEQVEPVVVDTGYSPFWFDDDTFGFVRPHPETGEDEVVLWSPESLDAIVTLSDIQDEVAGTDLSLGRIRYVLTHPAWQNKLIVVALDPLGREAFVFLYDHENGSLELRLQSDIPPYHSLGFSPNGRWLVLTGYENTDIVSSHTLILHDMQTKETQTYKSSLDGFILSPFYDWSGDGNWLLFPINDQVMSLVAPEYDYQMVKLHEQGFCTSLVWINR